MEGSRLKRFYCICKSPDTIHPAICIYLSIHIYVDIHIYITTYSKTSLNRLTMGPTLRGSFRTVVVLGS